MTPRPTVVEALEWTGSNLAEVEAFAARWGFSVVDNGDGTITTSGPICNGSNLPAGTWLVPAYAMAQTTDVIDANYRDLPSAGGPFQYTVTADDTATPA
jgi:hypothetical protein